MMSLYKDADWLYNQYIVERESTNSIGKKCGVRKDDVRYYLLKFNIPIRSTSEAQKLAFETGRSREHLIRNGEITGGFHGVHNEDTKRKISITKQKIDSEDWRGYISYEPYCEKFDIKLKEKIRNRDGRCCQLCGKSEILNGKRLSVHHIDGDKMQGCNGKKWYLAALCIACNNIADTIENEFLIVSNLRRESF